MKTDLSNFWLMFGYPAPIVEFKFHPERRWRFDFAWEDKKIAVEVQGGIFIRGAHARGAYIVKSQEKYNHAALMGWRIFYFQPKEFNNGIAVEILDRVFGIQRNVEEGKAVFRHG
jgi:very-short-patch-repair endonuclease